MKSHLESLLREALAPLMSAAGLTVPDSIPIDSAKDQQHGDFASNIALTLAKPLKRAPRQLAEAILALVPHSEWVSKVEVAGPGFINFFLAPAATQQTVNQILAQGDAFGRAQCGSKPAVLVEFVSANPTGPMHVGHGRGAAYGDALANLLAASGHPVLREYYVNDAGRQADILAASVWVRYLELCGESLEFPDNGYPADYVRACAARLVSEVGRQFCHPAAGVRSGLPLDEHAGGDKDRHIDALIGRMRSLTGTGYRQIQRFALDDQLADIRGTLEAFNVHYDRWASERDMVSSGAVQLALERLKSAGHTYEQDGALWLRTAELGDEKDRVLIKADGAATYFVNDIAYHLDKLLRLHAQGGTRLVDVWGADHHGYIARMKAAIQMLSGEREVLDVQLIQFVTLSSGRMGKRSGNFVTLGELIAEAGTDATRFFYLSRSHEQHLEFDIELARSRSNENPVYYVQYAHARVCSVFRQVQERALAFDPTRIQGSLHRLTEPREKEVLSQLARFPEAIANAALQRSPHQICFYLRELADSLHRWYAAQAFLVDDVELRTARLGLAMATRQVLVNGLSLIGVSAPAQM